MKLPISGIVITYNEETNIERCLKSLQFCSEIIVVDSGSTDRTVEIAKRFATVFTKKWDGYGSQKNFANAKSSYPWVLSLDADEEVTRELQHEIAALFAGGEPTCKVFSVPRKTIHFGRWIRFGGWYPNRLIRFFHKDFGSWSLDEIHEKWIAHGDVGILKHDLLHYSFSDFADQVERNNYYSSLGAIELKKKNVRFSIFKQIFKTGSKFVETYFIKLGFLDGYPGFIISISAAYSVFVKWAKLWEIRENEKRIYHHD